jgi:hypothetical protein
MGMLPLPGSVSGGDDHNENDREKTGCEPTQLIRAGSD